MQAKRRTILVVDDSDIILHILTRFFNGYNLEVIGCLNGWEGLKKAQENIPDLIFLDLMMPNFNGMDMLKVIKTIDSLKNIPIIIISGNTSKSNVLSVLSTGADRVIAKPLKKDIILKTIKELLGNDFLRQTVPNDQIKQVNLEDLDDEEYAEELCKIFLDEYPCTKRKMIESLKTKNNNLLTVISHEIRGIGSTMGYPEITKVCSEIEDALRTVDVDWDFVKERCFEFFTICEKIELAKNY